MQGPLAGAQHSQTHMPPMQKKALSLFPSLPSRCGPHGCVCTQRLSIKTATPNARADSPRKRLRPSITCPCVAPSTRGSPTHHVGAALHCTPLHTPCCSGRPAGAHPQHAPSAPGFVCFKLRGATHKQPPTGGCSKQCLDNEGMHRAAPEHFKHQTITSRPLASQPP